MAKLVFFLFSILLISCGNDYGNKVTGDKLTVYFTDKEDVSLAESIALYWKEKGFLTHEKQDLQLVRLDGKHQLRVITTSEESLKEMSFQERKLLNDLQLDLYKTVIKSPFELVICNEQFEPIYSMNE